MASIRYGLRHLTRNSTALRRLEIQQLRQSYSQRAIANLPARFFASAQPQDKEDEEKNQHTSTTEGVPNPPVGDISKPEEGSAAEGNNAPENEKPGAIGGFMRGLMGGQAVAVEDAFIAEAKQQGVEIPRPPQPRADLVPVKRRKRREEGQEEQTIRDRLFGRFAGSEFMKNAFEAKERIAEKIDESDNPIINMFRNVYDRFFAENEMGMVVREIREEDPNFRISEFLHEVENKFIPQILGAYLEGNNEALKGSCTEEAYAMLNASIRERNTEGVVMDTNILDIADVELTAGKLLEDAPVLIVTFSTQQINCLRDRGGNIVEGKEDDIRAVYYAWAFVKDFDIEDVMPTGGGVGADKTENKKEDDNEEEQKEENSKNRPWKLMEMVIRGMHSTI